MTQHLVSEVHNYETMQLTLSELRGLFEEVVLGKSRANVEVIVYGQHNIQAPVNCQSDTPEPMYMFGD
jgi:hypothetical protein